VYPYIDDEDAIDVLDGISPGKFTRTYEHRPVDEDKTRLYIELAIQWKDIVKAVSTEMKIANWMDVRGVLRFIKDNKMILRDPDIMTEAYTRHPTQRKH